MKDLEVKKAVKDLFDQGRRPLQIFNEINEDVSLPIIRRWCREFKVLGGQTPNDELETLNGTEDNHDSPLNGKQQTRKKKKVLLDVKKLFQDINDNSDESQWSKKEIRKTLEKLENLTHQVEGIFDDDKVLYGVNAIHTYLDAYTQIFERAFDMGDDFAFILDFSEMRKEEIQQILEITDFDTELSLDQYFNSRGKRMVCALVSEYLDLEDESINQDDISEFRDQVKDVKKFIKKNELKEDFRNELAVIDAIKQNLKDMSNEIKNFFLFDTTTVGLAKKWRKALKECQLENSEI